MGIFTDQIIERSSNALILSLTPTELLQPAEQAEKIGLIQARNRVLATLEKECSKLSDMEQSHMLRKKIKLIRDFFEKIGNKEEEQQICSLKIFNIIQKSIESPIPSAILLACKPDHECTEKNIIEKKKQKELGDSILKTTLKKTQSCPQTKENLEKFLNLLTVELTQSSQMMFQGG